MFLQTNNIGSSSGQSVCRSTKRKKGQNVLPAPRCQLYYMQDYNAVDQNDCDRADYTFPYAPNNGICVFLFGNWTELFTYHVVVIYCAK